MNGMSKHYLIAADGAPLSEATGAAEIVTEESGVTVLGDDDFAMDTQTRSNLKRAAAKATEKMLAFVESTNFERANVRDQLAVTNLLLDRAFGKADTLASMARANVINDGSDNDHGAQLSKITARARDVPEKRDRVPASRAAGSRRRRRGVDGDNAAPTINGGRARHYDNAEDHDGEDAPSADIAKNVVPLK